MTGIFHFLKVTRIHTVCLACIKCNFTQILNPLQWETLANSILPLEFFFSFLAVALFNSKSVHLAFNSPLCGTP